MRTFCGFVVLCAHIGFNYLHKEAVPVLVVCAYTSLRFINLRLNHRSTFLTPNMAATKRMYTEVSKCDITVQWVY